MQNALANFLNPLGQTGSGTLTTLNIPTIGPAQAASFPIVGSGLQGVAAISSGTKVASNALPVASNDGRHNASLSLSPAPSFSDPLPSARMDDGIYNPGVLTAANANPAGQISQQMAVPNQPISIHTY